MSYHSCTIPSLNNEPNPSGTVMDADQPGPSQMNPLQCSYPCTIEGCGTTIDMFFVPPATFDQTQPFNYGPGFTVPNQDYEVGFVYEPPLS